MIEPTDVGAREDPLPWSSRRPKWARPAFLGAIASGLGLRCLLVVQRWSDPLPYSDALWYSSTARVIADGRGFVDAFGSGPTAEHGPLTPLVLATVSFGESPIGWQRLLVALTGVVGVVAIAWLAYLVGGRRTALAAAAIAALYPNLWMNDIVVMSEALACLLVALFMGCAVRFVTTGRLVWVGLCGLGAGLATLTRSELALCLVVLPLVIRHASPSGTAQGSTRTRTLAVVSFAVPALAVVGLWVIPNLNRFERPVVLTTNDGTTLLGANCPPSYSLRGGRLGGWSLECVLAFEPSDDGGDASVRASQQRSAALDYAREHAARIPLVLVARAGRIIDMYGWRDLVRADVAEGKPRWASWLGIGVFWILMAVALTGVRRLEAWYRWILAAPVLAVIVASLLFYGAHRIRAPAEPSLVVAAASALVARIRAPA